MKRLRRPIILWPLVAVFVLVAAISAFVAIVGHVPSDGRVKLKSQRTYTQGNYYAFVQPWGVENSRLMRPWGSVADTVSVDMKAFPGNTSLYWRWPPFTPRNGVGVWGYNHIGFGNYDDGRPEQPIPARQVKDISALAITYDWDGSFRFGEATLLTEFFLRSDPEDAESKGLEVGWFLHVSDRTKKFVDTGKQIGTYTDPDGNAWQVALNEEFCTFSLVGGKDSHKGRIDMLHATRWLMEKGLVKGDEWFTGVAIGTEPISGIGHVDLRDWRVEYR
ncbi:hypothetical protein GRI97_02200 [Altererythrobacter xixiisoli]|uniref:Uncharacterized protein n=1 Tax=Croceibacterium xixiisoli TaxID=1476466 RepID=A0A6I4TR62_9SPHN|nr:hypothetical protein [Croceibacterium xixiisoli]MXO97799.1 hypothetical protein [Croceibacterium xixiisoli]